MLRRLRRQLALIRYYSADRPRSAWDKAMPWAVVAALVLAPIATVLGDRGVRRGTGATQVFGRLTNEPGGSVRAVVVPPERAYDPMDDDTRADVTLHIPETRYGMPFTSTRELRPARVDLSYPDRGARVNAVLPAGAPERRALERALRNDGRSDAFAAFTRTSPVRVPNPGGWIANSIAWWFVLAVGFVLALRLAQVTTLVYGRKHQLRRRELAREGLCHNCGYDLRGIEFSPRCPECGAVV